MQVQALIEILKKYDPTREVFFECEFNDCFVDTVKVIEGDIYLSDSGDHT